VAIRIGAIREQLLSRGAVRGGLQRISAVNQVPGEGADGSRRIQTTI
jgi:hypothetical protein